MDRIALYKERPEKAVLEDISSTLGRRASAGMWGTCPVSQVGVFLGLSASQSCGKCAPCRVGLPVLVRICNDLLAGDADESALEEFERWSQAIFDSADCAIGYEAAIVAQRALAGLRKDFEAHAKGQDCAAGPRAGVPCRSQCPAEVDIPGYIALAGKGRYSDALRLIRKDNPFPLACGLICEHPCEQGCRRGIVDSSVHIRAVKRFCVEQSPESFDVDNAEVRPFHYESTGKRIAVVGAGPAGLTAAYFLTLMGHSVTVYEQRDEPGGMMRYGIPAYRLPRERLQSAIDWICAQGIDLKCGVSVGTDITLADLREQNDAVYLAIGAHV